MIHSAAFRRLQGKTQLFPNNESDFFRNRLTHSLEVAQIAKSIAIRLNATESFFHGRPIDTDLVETAALAHDLGHPPFGHNGEDALDECMALHGGFEGNAQTLRILSKLEKKRTIGPGFKSVDDKKRDNRAGLNLTARTLAAVLKYDKEIPRLRKTRPEGDVKKGYYYTEADQVAFVKKQVLAGSAVPAHAKFKTLECTIMDVADDIAYSTYDIEDAMKGGFTTCLEMIAAPEQCLEEVTKTIQKRLKEFYSDLAPSETVFSPRHAREVFLRNFAPVFDLSDAEIQELTKQVPKTGDFLQSVDWKAFLVASGYDLSKELANVGYRRTQFTSDLVGKFVRGVEFVPNHSCPPLSAVRLRVDLFKEVETFKVFAYENLIRSPRLKLAEYSGKDIVRKIFKTLNEGQHGYLLLPDDFRELYDALADSDEKARAVCDFVAGMTDRYAIEFYGRLTAPDKATFWKPL